MVTLMVDWLLGSNIVIPAGKNSFRPRQAQREVSPYKNNGQPNIEL